MWPFRRGRSPGRSDGRLGRRGETLAVRCLRGKGYKILARNFRCPSGEADIIALDPSAAASGSGTIAFVEVKTRSSDAYVDPESAIDARKRRQLARVARDYLAGRDAADYAVRFDVVAVVVPDGARPQVRHTIATFEPA